MQTLKDLMSKDVQVIGPDETIRAAAQKMRDGNFGMMPVGAVDNLIGTLSDRDIAIRGVADGKDAKTTVRQVMTEGIVCTSIDDSVDTAAALMAKHQIRRLPVLDKDKRLVGIVALGDFAVVKGDIAAASNALSGISKPN